MRLIDIYNIIMENREIACGSTLNIQDNGPECLITGQDKMIQALKKLDQIPVFKSYIEPLKKISSIYNDTLETINCSISYYNEFKNGISVLNKKCLQVLEIIKGLIDTQPQNTISVKFPETNNLGELADYIKNLGKLLEQLVVDEEIDGKVELSKVDSGSIWFDICLFSQAAVFIVGSAAWAAAMVRKKKIEGDILLQQNKKYNLQAEVLKSIKDGIEKEINSIVSSEFENSLSQTNINLNEIKSKNPEYSNRVLHVINEFVKLFNKGMEIHSPLEAPESVKNLFPDFENLHKLESKIHQLEGKNDSTDENNN